MAEINLGHSLRYKEYKNIGGAAVCDEKTTLVRVVKEGL